MNTLSMQRTTPSTGSPGKATMKRLFFHMKYLEAYGRAAACMADFNKRQFRNFFVGEVVRNVLLLNRLVETPLAMMDERARARFDLASERVFIQRDRLHDLVDAESGKYPRGDARRTALDRYRHFINNEIIGYASYGVNAALNGDRAKAGKLLGDAIRNLLIFDEKVLKIKPNDHEMAKRIMTQTYLRNI